MSYYIQKACFLHTCRHAQTHVNGHIALELANPLAFLPPSVLQKTFGISGTVFSRARSPSCHQNQKWQTL